MFHVEHCGTAWVPCGFRGQAQRPFFPDPRNRSSGIRWAADLDRARKRGLAVFELLLSGAKVEKSTRSPGSCEQCLGSCHSRLKASKVLRRSDEEHQSGGRSACQKFHDAGPEFHRCSTWNIDLGDETGPQPTSLGSNQERGLVGAWTSPWGHRPRIQGGRALRYVRRVYTGRWRRRRVDKKRPDSENCRAFLYSCPGCLELVDRGDRGRINRDVSRT